MFRIESYITSIILSYVDRYVKNFRRQDAQVSLWEGDGSLHNLDLDLEVLEQELNLPFSFISGHIHHLLIHVPWTRIASLPVKITINTIECVMKLKTPGAPSASPSSGEKKKKFQNTSNEETMAPPTYMSSLVNKIVCNLSVTCNNLILKYVEDDIVLSMNIKTLSLDAVNSKWMREFSELTPAQLILRKLINLSDVTICLDKRNTLGRIDSYLEPILYKCSLAVRLSLSYKSVNSIRAHSTRVAILCQNVTLSISEPQVSMLLRLALLARMTVNQKKSSSFSLINCSDSTIIDSEGDMEETGESWASWVWGWVPALLPTNDSPTMEAPSGHSLHLGSYIHNFTVDFKLMKKDDGKVWDSLMQIVLGGCFTEMVSGSSVWTNLRMGVCSINVFPTSQGAQESYISCGVVPETFESGSLFENPDDDLPVREWDQHITSLNEISMLERSPTFSMDYLSVLEVAPGFDSEFNIPSEPRERVLLRYVFGPIILTVCSGLIERILMIQKALESYDYLPYAQSLSSSASHMEESLIREDYDNVDNYVAKHISQFTVLGAKIKIYHADYPAKKPQKRSSSEHLRESLNPYLLISLSIFDAKLVRPLDLERLFTLIKVKPIKKIISESQTSFSILMRCITAQLMLNDNAGREIVEIPNLYSEFFLNNFIPMNLNDSKRSFSLDINSITVSTSKASLDLSTDIVTSVLGLLANKSTNLNPYLVQDCFYSEGAILQLIFTKVHLKADEREWCECGRISIETAKAMVGHGKDKKSNMILCSETPNEPVFEVTVQRPVGDASMYFPILIFRLRKTTLTFEQLLHSWLCYVPRKYSFRWDPSIPGVSHKISSGSLGSAGKKIPESTESQSAVDIDKKISIPSPDDEDSFIVKWLGLVVCGEVTDLTFVMETSPSFGSILVQVPSIHMRSSQGKLNLSSDNLPIVLPESIASKDGLNSPWSIGLTDMSCQTVIDDSTAALLKSLSLTCTIAVTTKQNVKLNKLSSVSLCLYVDTSPVSVGLSQPQVVLIAEVMASVAEVMNVLSPPVIIKTEDAPVLASDTVQSSDDSPSISQPPSPFALEEKTKVTYYVQWTLTKSTLSLFSNTHQNPPQKCKLVLELEDIFITLDIEKVYQMMKLKVATAIIHHYVRDYYKLGWRLGEYSGVLMKGRESETEGNNPTTEFLNVTITRASAANLHARLNTSSLPIKKIMGNMEERYINEVVVKLEPLEFIMSPLVMGKYYGVLEPLLDEERHRGGLGGRRLGSPHHHPPPPAPPPPQHPFTTASLPLLYLDIQSVTLILPTSQLVDHKFQPDVIIADIENICLKSEAVNPVSRKILRSDLYSSAQRARVTSVPGSHLEDRQYQLDLSLTINSGRWSEIKGEVETEENAVQNPAVYWNWGIQPGQVHLTPLLSSSNISLIVAPPILTNGFVISGLNIELNVISAVDLSLDLGQMKLLNELLNEIKMVLPGQNIISERSFDESKEVMDSGMESTDGSHQKPFVKKEYSHTDSFKYTAVRSCSLSQISVSTPTSINTKRSRHRSQTVPIDILVTGKEVRLRLFDFKTDNSIPQQLFSLLITQPYISLEKQGDISVYKGSIFDLNFKVSGNFNKKREPDCVITTKSGDPDPYKGIPPALLTIKSTTQGIKPPTIDIDIGRPLKLSFSVPIINFLGFIRDQVLSIISIDSEGNLKTGGVARSEERLSNTEPSINKLKQYTQVLSALNLSTKQMVLDLQVADQGGGGSGVLLSVGSTLGSIQVGSTWSQQRSMSCSVNFRSLTLSCIWGLEPRLLIEPHSFQAGLSLAWESWLPLHHPPVVSATYESDILALELSPKHLQVVKDVVGEFLPFFKAEDSAQTEKQAAPSDVFESTNEDEQHYKDDLQAGAFQLNSSQDVPLAYQVSFPSHVHMAWTYPAPRAIVSLNVLPIPFREACPDGVKCAVQHYIGGGRWRDWLQFSLSEGDIQHPEITREEVASTWRVLIMSNTPPVSVQALAAALRVNSMFSPRLIPRVKLGVCVDSVQVSLWADMVGACDKLPHPFSRYTPDGRLPREFSYATAYVNNIKLNTISRHYGYTRLEGGLELRLDVVNCRSLEEQCVLQPWPLSGTISYDPTASVSTQVSLLAGPLTISMAPPLTHTIFSTLNSAVLMPYVICNDTCFPIRLGQVGTNEDIVLLGLQCHFYAWATTRQNMQLRVSLNTLTNKDWSRGISLDKTENVILELLDESERSVTVIISIKQLSSTVTQVTIMGELVLYNMLERVLDIRVVANTILERQRGVGLSPCARAPSIVLSRQTKYSLRLSTEGPWSGLVPISVSTNAWLVKIPLKDKQDFQSIWCQIFREEDVEIPRILVVLSPIYLLKSLLPCDTNVMVNTEELGSTKMQRVKGQGHISNLNTPGTTAHQHLLTFHFDGNLPASSPHVPLSYSLLDGKSPVPPPVPNLEVLLDWTERPPENNWPLLSPIWSSTPWRPPLQPYTVTHVKMKLGADPHRVTNSLLVELQPWALLVNTLGLPISLYSSEKILCSLANFSILAPPPLEETFYLAVELYDTYHRSDSLQLSKSQVFYMPHISGLIPYTGHIQSHISTSQSVISATIYSKMESGIRILHVMSSYTIVNISSYDLIVAPLLISKDGNKVNIPETIVPYSIDLPRQSLPNISGHSITEWHKLGNGGSIHKAYLLFGYQGMISKPILVSSSVERDSTSLTVPHPPGYKSNFANFPLVVVLQKKDGVTYITVDDQLYPQVVIQNSTQHSLAIVRSDNNEDSNPVDDCEDWNWKLIVEGGMSAYYNLPESQPNIPLPPILVSRPEFNYGWSTPISLMVSTGSRLVNVPHCHDLSVTVIKRGFTLYVNLSPANQSVISASDIRTRLSQQASGFVRPSLEDTNDCDKDFLPDDKNQEKNSSASATTIKSGNDGLNVQISCFVQRATLILCRETGPNYQWTEVAALTFDNVALTVDPKQDQFGKSKFGLTVWDIQLDNQEHQTGSYDFSVVLVRNVENCPEPSELFASNDPNKLVDSARQNSPAIHLELDLDPASPNWVEGIKLNLSPLQLYLEDTFLTHLKDQLTNLLPSTLLSGLSRFEETRPSSPSSLELRSRPCHPGPSTSNQELDENDELFNVSDVESPPAFPLSLAKTELNQYQEEEKEEEDILFKSESLRLSEARGSNFSDISQDTEASTGTVPVTGDLLTASKELSRPLRLSQFTVSQFNLLVSVHTSSKFYIALDNSPLGFATFTRSDLITTPYRLGHALTLHYFLGAIYGTGWALGSLQLLGAPAGLARSVGSGLRSFVTLPYRGIMEGPTGFIAGIFHGSASLMKHITAGTLMSVTKFASSWSRTLDRLTLSDEDLRYAEEMRRVKPQGLAQALRQGLTELGVSILGGVGGLAQQPLQYALSENESLVGSVSRGLVGVMARPLSGAAELVALTGHGILSGAGWADNHKAKHESSREKRWCDRGSDLKYNWKVLRPGERLLVWCEATSSSYEPLCLVVSSTSLYLISKDDTLLSIISLTDLVARPDPFDPTLIRLHTQTPETVAEKMSEKRIRDFVRQAQLAMTGCLDNHSIPSTPGGSEPELLFYISPRFRDFFLASLDLAIRHATNRGFPVSV